MLFLAEFNLVTTEYMNDSTRKSMLRLIRANDEKEARDKLEKHFEDQSSSYSVHYLVEIVEISAIIE